MGLDEGLHLRDLAGGLRHGRAAVACPQSHAVLQVQRVVDVRFKEVGGGFELLQGQLLQRLPRRRALGNQMAGDGVGIPEGHALFVR